MCTIFMSLYLVSPCYPLVENPPRCLKPLAEKAIHIIQKTEKGVNSVSGALKDCQHSIKPASLTGKNFSFWKKVQKIKLSEKLVFPKMTFTLRAVQIVPPLLMKKSGKPSSRFVFFTLKITPDADFFSCLLFKPKSLHFSSLSLSPPPLGASLQMSSIILRKPA